MLNLQLENLGGYTSKPMKLRRPILIVALTLVSSDKVALMGQTGISLLFPFQILDFFHVYAKTIDIRIGQAA